MQRKARRVSPADGRARDQERAAETDLVSHDVSKKTGVSGVDSESVRGHGVVNLLDDRRSGGLDPEHRRRLHDLSEE